MGRSLGAFLILALWLSACSGGTATPSQPAPLVLKSGPLAVSIAWPVNDTVVSSTPVYLVGRAAPETVISVGDMITVVAASGQFSILLPLEEGPNELDIVASDPDGNEASATLVVTYEPGS